MSKFKEGDKVFVNVDRDKLGDILSSLESNKLAYNLLKCYTATATEIIRVGVGEGFNGIDLYYLKADNGVLAWKFNELSPIEDKFTGMILKNYECTSEEAKLICDALIDEGFSPDDIQYLLEDDELRIFRKKEAVFNWFNCELPYFGDILDSIKRIVINTDHVGMSMEDLIYTVYLEKQENYKEISDNLYIAWYL